MSLLTIETPPPLQLRSSVGGGLDDGYLEEARVGGWKPKMTGVSKKRESVVGNYRGFETTLPRGTGTAEASNETTPRSGQCRNTGNFQTPTIAVSQSPVIFGFETPPLAVSQSPVIDSFETPVIAVVLRFQA